jgi:protoporphyrinogen oxidase
MAVLGAGPGGLAGAWALARQGHEVTLFERNDEVGGLAASRRFDGHTVDLGSHRLHPGCRADIRSDIEGFLEKHRQSRLIERPRKGCIYLAGGITLPFPIELASLLLTLGPRFLGSVALDQVRRAKEPGKNFEAELLRQFGRTLADTFYFPYVKKVWGADLQELSPELVRIRVSGGSKHGLWKKAWNALSSKKKYFLYPEKGFGALSEAYKDAFLAADGHLRLGVTLKSLKLTQSQLRLTFTTKKTDQFQDFDHVLSSIPPQSLLSLLGLRPKRTLRYRSLLLLYIALEQNQWSEFDAHYFPQRDVLASRISEVQNYHGAIHQSPGTVLCAEIPCEKGGEIYHSSAEDLLPSLTKSLKSLHRPLGPVSKTKIVRLDQAYPIFDKTYQDQLQDIDQQLSAYPTIHSFGRQGLFAHDNTHHALSTAYQLSDCFESGSFDRERWERSKLEFHDHFVED